MRREVAEGTLRIIPLSGAPITHDISFIRLPNSIFETELQTFFHGLVDRLA